MEEAMINVIDLIVGNSVKEYITDVFVKILEIDWTIRDGKYTMKVETPDGKKANLHPGVDIYCTVRRDSLKARQTPHTSEFIIQV